MVKTFKFGEPSKIINFRVPMSRVSEFRPIIQKAINDYYYGNELDFPEPKNGNFKRLYQIMNTHLIPKLSNRDIAQIPAKVLEEIEKMEVEYNF